jgi:hypothetical protein
MQPKVHKDKLNNELAVGDFVVYPNRNSLVFGRVMKLNNKMIGVTPVLEKRYSDRNSNRYPSDLVRLDPADMTWYLLKNTT